MNKILQLHVAELLGHDEVQQLLDMLGKSNPKLAEELVPNAVTLQQLLRVLRNLLEEQIPIRDMRTIAEAIAGNAELRGDMDALCAAVRNSLSRIIVQKIYGDEEVLPVVTLDPELEQLLQQSMLSARQNGETDIDAIIEPGLAQKLQESIRQAAQQQEIGGKPAVLLVSGVIRALLSKFARYAHSSVHVLAFNEIPPTKQLTIEATLA